MFSFGVLVLLLVLEEEVVLLKVSGFSGVQLAKLGWLILAAEKIRVKKMVNKEN